MPPRLPTGPPKEIAFTVQMNVPFTTREIEFIKYRISKEMSLKEIATVMGISGRTVHALGTIVYVKLGISSISHHGSDTPIIALTKWAIAHKLVTLEGEP
jgi:DNA-binding CsgD family transcriptional regulator